MLAARRPRGAPGPAFCGRERAYWTLWEQAGWLAVAFDSDRGEEVCSDPDEGLHSDNGGGMLSGMDVEVYSDMG